jgi:hypothetical protein
VCAKAENGQFNKSNRSYSGVFSPETDVPTNLGTISLQNIAALRNGIAALRNDIAVQSRICNAIATFLILQCKLHCCF